MRERDASQIHDVLAPIVESFLERFRAGERPSIEEYAAQQPELAEEIRELLPALMALERDLIVERGERSAATIRSCIPERLGDYLIVREIGRGGMGVVYEAMQQSLGRQVALKVLSWPAAGSSSVERFRREARAAARLHHTNIVPVFGVGEEDQTHYIAMQYIRGQGLDQVIAELRRLRSLPVARAMREPTVAARLLNSQFNTKTPDDTADPKPDLETTPDVARARRPLSGTSASTAPLGERSSEKTYFDSVTRIVQQVAEALSYAHDQGIIHRDVKPSNILLDTRGTAWVTDFGIAKAEDEDGPTRTGDIVGTLRYMAPERFDGISDRGSDVYGLGATFYELLTLKPVFEDVARPRLIEQIQRREPVRPRLVDQRIPRDLEVICTKCLAKEPPRRYASAGSLAEDLRRYLNGQTIEARHSGSLERSYRWCRRNPTVAGLLLALLASLITGLVSVSYQAWQTKLQRDDARNAATAATKARVAESATRLEAQRLAARAALTQGRSLADQGAVAQGMHWLAAALHETPEEDRDLERVVGRNLASYGYFLARSSLLLLDAPIPTSTQLSHDGTLLATTHAVGGSDNQHEGRFWDMATGHPVGVTIAGAARLCLAPNGKTVAAVLDDGTIRYLDIATGRAALEAPPSEINSPLGAIFSPDGKLIAEFGGVTSGGQFLGAVRLLDAASGQPIGTTLKFGSVAHGAAFRPDSRGLAVICTGVELSLWELNPKARAILQTRCEGTWLYPPVTFDPDGRFLVTWWNDGNTTSLRFWDAATGRMLERRMDLDGRFVHSLSFSPDGRHLLTSETGGVVQLWDATIDRPVTFPIVRIPERTPVTFIPSGDAFLVGQNERPSRARLVAIPEGLELAEPSDSAEARALTALPDRLGNDRNAVALAAEGNRIVASGRSAGRIIDLATGLPVGEPFRNRWQSPGCVAVNRDATIAAFVYNNLSGPRPNSIDCLVEVWSLADGRRRCAQLHPSNTVVALALSPDDRIVAAGDYSNIVQLWNAGTGAPLGPPIAAENIVWSLAFSPDGTRLAVATHRERTPGKSGVQIWDLSTRRAVGPLVSHRGTGVSEILLWSDDGSRLTTLCRETSDVIQVDGRTGVRTARATDFTAAPTTMITGPDSGTLLIGTSEGALELRDNRNLKRRGSAMAPPDQSRLYRSVTALAIAPGGRTVAVGHIDGSIRLWDLRTRLPIGPQLHHLRSVQLLAFRQSGRVLASISKDGEVRSWPVPEPKPEQARHLAARLAVETGLRLNATQNLEILSPEDIESQTRDLAESVVDGEPIDERGRSSNRHNHAALYAEHRALWHAALFHLDQLISVHPVDGSLRVRRALALAGTGQREKASTEFTRALELGPRQDCINLLVQRAYDESDAGRLEHAAWALDHAMAARPDDWWLYADRADVRARLGDLAGRDSDRRLAANLGADALYLVQLAIDLDSEGQAEAASELRALAATRLGKRDSPAVYRSIASELARRGKLASAANLLESANDSRPSSSLNSAYFQALRAVAARDTAAYRSICAKALAKARADDSPLLLNQVAWICSLGPRATDDPDRIVALAQSALKHSAAIDRHQFLNTLGAALVRADKPAEAIERLHEGIQLRANQALPQDRVFLALAKHAQGHADQASHDLTARATTPASVEDDIEARVLFQEAIKTVLDSKFPSQPFAQSQSKTRATPTNRPVGPD